MADIPQEVVEQMVQLVRQLADQEIDERYNLGVKEARAIVALLPEPVDPDLQEVRRLAKEHSVSLSDEGARAIVAYFKGKQDAGD